MDQFKNNQPVFYNNGIIKGTGIIKGVVGLPKFMNGTTYIIEDQSNNIPNETYPYSCFVCIEQFIQVLR